MSCDLASSSLSDHFEKWEHAPGQQGSQYEDGQNDKKMSEMILSEVKDSSESIDFVTKRNHTSQRCKKPSVKGIMPLFVRVIHRFPSGIGRTNIFCSTILGELDYNLVECQALILAPTHEKSQEIELVTSTVGRDLGVKVVHAFVGKKTSVEEKNHVVVGTPADVLDLLKSNSLNPDNIKMFVLDDADEMISLGLHHQIYNIFLLLPSNLQLGVFAKSITRELREFMIKLSKCPA